MGLRFKALCGSPSPEFVRRVVPDERVRPVVSAVDEAADLAAPVALTCAGWACTARAYVAVRNFLVELVNRRCVLLLLVRHDRWYLRYVQPVGRFPGDSLGDVAVFAVGGAVVAALGSLQ